MLLDAQSPADVAQAAQVLARGDLLGLPTETVYGLAADAGQDAAVRRIFAAKGRPAEHPLIVHVVTAADVTEFAREVPDFAQRLMAAFWPGPLTLILPRRADRAAVAAGGQDSVGLRCPSHPAAQAVLRQARTLGVLGVAAPSANLFGRVSPTTAAHVQAEFPTLAVLDGGACEVGIESTIVDCTRGVPVLLRPGLLTPAQLGAACGVAVLGAEGTAHVTAPHAPDAAAPPASPAPRASGTLESHYAPRALVRLLSAEQLREHLRKLPAGLAPKPAAAAADDEAPPPLAVWSRTPPDALPRGICHQPMPDDAAMCAHQLFATLRDFDARHVQEIWVEAPPAGDAWDGVRDRLTRAASPNR